MSALEPAIVDNPGTVWRVGFRPYPWAWTPWEYAPKPHLFTGRWDDPEGQFRNLYSASELFGAFLEVLAHFSPDIGLGVELDLFEDEDGSAAAHPTAYGIVGYEWLENRVWTRGTLLGGYLDVTHSSVVGQLRRVGVFSRHGIRGAETGTDLLKSPHQRALTADVANQIYYWAEASAAPGGARLAGIAYRSRHGDDLRLWATFENPDEGLNPSPWITPNEHDTIAPDHPDLERAFRALGLRWEDAT